MVEWFHERYIARQEHEEIVAYYRKLVAQLHCTARDLRTQIDDRTDTNPPAAEPEHAPVQQAPVQQEINGPNVITIDFQRHHRPAGSRGG